MPEDERYVIDLELSQAPDSAGIARRFVAHNSDHLPPDLVQDAELLVSELVTNAVLHGRPQITLHIDLDPPDIGVSVTDGGHGFRRPSGQPSPTDTHGRGLLIVEAIARQHGITTLSSGTPGTTVWFELTAHDYT